MSRLAPAPRSGLRAVAVATLVAFGCATTREPLPPSPPAPPVERVYFEDPEMELWVGRPRAGARPPPAPSAPAELPPAR